MGDEEHVSRKRVAGREISKDNPDPDENTPEPEMGTFQKASEEVMATRRIVRVKRNQPSSIPNPNPSPNPFASIRLFSSTPTTPSDGSNAKASEKTEGEEKEAVEREEVGGERKDETEEKKESGDEDEVQEEREEVGGERKEETEEKKESGDKDEVKEEREELGGEKKEETEEKKESGDKDEVKEKREEVGGEKREETEEKKESGDKDEVNEEREELGGEGKDETEKPGGERKEEREEEEMGGDRKEALNEEGKTEEKNETGDKTETKEEREGEAVGETKEETDEKEKDKKEESKPARPFSSFGQLSSSQNAFTGLAGTGFASSPFTFGPVTTSSSLFSTVNTSTTNNNGSSSSDPPKTNKISMPEVHVETGEENEKSIFNADSVLYEYLDGGWKERGKGEIKLNISTLEGSEKEKSRLVMRAKGNLRLILNANLYADMAFKDMDKRGVTFACVNSVGEGQNGLSTFALKFRDGGVRDEFSSTVEKYKWKRESGELANKTPENSPKVETEA